MKATIYIADDDAGTLQAVHWAIANRGNGYTCCLATNGQEILDLISVQGLPDLLILDLAMPHKDGLTVLSEISCDKLKYDFPVLVITGSVDSSQIRAARLAGADDVIVKPFSADDLIIRVDKLVARYSASNDLKRSIRLLNDENRTVVFDAYIAVSMLTERRDGRMAVHIDRVGEIAYAIAQRMSGLHKDILSTIRDAAKIHDIGKHAIKDEILLKPGKLTAEEFNIIKTHTLEGAAAVAATPNKNTLFEKAHQIVLYHHEQFNGKGYPYGLKGSEIPVAARITACADVFDALTHERPYKEAWSQVDAAQLISDGRGAQFDPEVVDIFMSLFKEGAFAAL